MNAFKSFILISLLTAVLVALGFFLYGEQGVVLALGLGVLLNGFSYFFSDRIVLASYGAQVIGPQDAPDLYRIVEKLTRAAGLPMPRVAIIADETPNAFATGRNPEHAVVAVTTGLLNTLERGELEGVLAHELGHVKNRDILIGSLASVLAQAIMFLSHMAVYIMPRDEDDRPNPIAAILIYILGPIAAMLLQMAISRSREYLADEYAAHLTGRPDQLASALARISGLNQMQPLRDAEPSSAHMMIVNPLSGGGIFSLFSTHPPIAKRIERLNSMRIQMS